MSDKPLCYDEQTQLRPGPHWALALVMATLVACGDDDGGNNQVNTNQNNNASTRCGNGTLEGSEECDDGSANSDSTPDACRTDCTLSRCGDGVMDTGEGCDQGLANSDTVPDSCRADCQPARCGDGVVDIQGNETCDDGDLLPTQTCSDQCLVIYCGNGTLDVGEVCDDGNVAPRDGCSPDCQSREVCGNGVIDTLVGEECDDASDNSDSQPDACRTDCFLPGCGDGVVDAEEECDDGDDNSNTQPDACRLDCSLPRCGDGVTDASEICDDGNNAVGDHCTPDCESNETCGNNYLDPTNGEECDDGNDVTGDGCGLTCKIERCGNDVDDPGEVCDDGNLLSGDGCSGDCLSTEGWGNGYVDYATGEQCDDGNLRSHDGCSSDCLVEIPLWQRWQYDLNLLRRTPAIAYDHARDRVVLFGGRRGNVFLDDTWEYTTLQWVRATTDATHPMSGPSNFYEMTYDRAREVSVMYRGGTSVWEFDGTVWREVTTAHAAPSNSFAMAYHDGLGQVILFSRPTTEDTDNTWAYDGFDWTPITVSASPLARTNVQMVYDSGRDVIVLHGGYDGEDALDDTWEFDGDWTQATPTGTPPAVYYHHLAYDEHRGEVVCYQNPDTWEYDGDRWRPVTTGTSPGGSGAVMVYHAANQRVMYTADQGIQRTWEFDGADWTEADPATAPPAGANFEAAFDQDRGKVVLFGGGAESNDTWDFDGTQWIQRSPVHRPPGRSYHALAYDPVNQQTVLFGGSTGSGLGFNAMGDTWVWDGGDWIEMTPAHKPGKRGRHRMVWDTQRQRVVLFGGYLGDRFFYNDTWAWDGADWERITTTGNPSVRGYHSLAYDSAREQLVLFSGLVVMSVRDDTWVLDATTWEENTYDPHPGGSTRGRMVFNPDRGRTLLFGGYHTYGLPGYDETWEFDGTEWTELFPPAAPIGRDAHGLVYDSWQRVIVLHGGQTPINDETWYFQFVSSGPDEVCASGADDDGDGLTDCDDPDCNQALECQPGERCDNGVDDDGDGLSDCEDPNCGGFPCGAGGAVCFHGACRLEP